MTRCLTRPGRSQGQKISTAGGSSGVLIKRTVGGGGAGTGAGAGDEGAGVAGGAGGAGGAGVAGGDPGAVSTSVTHVWFTLLSLSWLNSVYQSGNEIIQKQQLQSNGHSAVFPPFLLLPFNLFNCSSV